MNNYLKGTVRNIFFKSDNGYMVGIIKVKDIDEELNEYLNKTLTFTGTFYDLKSNNDYIFYGEIVNHPRYGLQFNVSRYEQIKPETKNGVIAYLSSDIFKGVGLKTATNIVDELGENALDIILDDYHKLMGIPNMTEKKATKIYKTLEKEAGSYKTITYLQNLGFTINEASKIYNRYKNETKMIIEDNIYKLIEDVEGLGFVTIDNIVIKQNIEVDNQNRILACILYVMMDLCQKNGNIYNEIEDIYLGVTNYLNESFEEETFNYYLMLLNKENKIIIEAEKYYLEEYYRAEKNNALKLLTLLNNNEELVDIKKYIKRLEKEHNIKYNDKQKEAIEYSVQKNLLIITGGPGTGKTTILKAIVDLYKDINKLSKEELLENIALLAPTGRAAKRIKEATNISSMTIHKFLRWNKETNDFGVNINNKSSVKLVIVDEVSMIDNFLLNNLLNGLKDNVKLILVGDHNQLPSVSPGQVLKDLIESNVVPVVRLNDLYRQQENSYIINLAHEIKEGFLSPSFLTKKDDYNFIECAKLDIKNIIIKLCEKALEKGFNYRDLQILVPMYKGANGIDIMNKVAQEIFNPYLEMKKEFEYQGVIYREGDKVLQIKNNNDLNISNGDIGIIKEIFKEEEKNKFLIDFDGEEVVYSLKEFEDIRLGYAISIHKAQGSEFDIVIIPLDMSFSRMLFRKLIYTAITRAKKSLMLVGEKDAFIFAVKKAYELKRKTSLCEMLKKYNKLV